MSDWKNQQCGDCEYWIKLADGAKKNPSGAALIGAPASGECRHGPIGVTALPLPNGMVARTTEYPLPLASQPACSRYEPREAVNGRLTEVPDHAPTP